MLKSRGFGPRVDRGREPMFQKATFKRAKRYVDYLDEIGITTVCPEGNSQKIFVKKPIDKLAFIKSKIKTK